MLVIYMLPMASKSNTAGIVRKFVSLLQNPKTRNVRGSAIVASEDSFTPKLLNSLVETIQTEINEPCTIEMKRLPAETAARIAKNVNLRPKSCRPISRHRPISHICRRPKSTLPRGPKGHACPICNKIFPWLGSLKKHMQTHVTMYKCKECEYTSTQPHLMTEHLITHMKSRLHKCKQCGAEYGSVKALIRHINTNHGYPKHKNTIVGIKVGTHKSGHASPKEK